MTPRQEEGTLWHYHNVNRALLQQLSWEYWLVDYCTRQSSFSRTPKVKMGLTLDYQAVFCAPSALSQKKHLENKERNMVQPHSATQSSPKNICPNFHPCSYHCLLKWRGTCSPKSILTNCFIYRNTPASSLNHTIKSLLKVWGQHYFASCFTNFH